jgi:DNA polymerase-3 subunit alpha
LNKNNVITTGCIKSKFNYLILNKDFDKFEKLIKKFKEVFEDNFYFEIQLNNLDMQSEVNEVYRQYSKKFNIKPVFALDYHYCEKDDWYIQYLLYVIKSRASIYSMPPDDWFYTVRDLYIKDIDEIYKIAKEQNFDIDFLDEAIDSTFEIKDKTNIGIEYYKNNYPKFNPEEGDSRQYLRKLLKEKLTEKLELGLIPEDEFEVYKKRLKYELDTIENLGVGDYFLIIYDIIENLVKKSSSNIGVGRGSAGGSLILFILDITKIDPIKYDLIFERFLNPGRCLPEDYSVIVSGKK